MSSRLAATGRIECRLGDGNVFETWVLGHPICGKAHNRKPLQAGGRIIYFKVNRREPYTLRCIQQWVRVAECLGADYCFVCDDPKLEFDILRTCEFGSRASVRFIRSRRGELRGMAANLCTGGLSNMTCAHLTPFLDARSSGIDACWMIDADDTTMLLPPDRAAEALAEAERLAEAGGACAMALDMWRSRTRNLHWSLGVVYVSGVSRLYGAFRSAGGRSWASALEGRASFLNLDWFMTAMKEEGEPIETFYVENCWFVHWGDFLLMPTGAGVNVWREGRIEFPIIEHVLQADGLGAMEIGDCAKVDIGLDGSEGPEYLRAEVCLANRMAAEERRTHQVDGAFPPPGGIIPF